MAQLRIPRGERGAGQFAPSGKGRSEKAETRFKIFGGELIYRQRGGSWGDLAEALQGTFKRTTRLQPAWLAWQEVWLQQNQIIFDDEGTSEEAWEPLTEKYAAEKAKHSDGGILVYTGRLKESLTDPSSPDMIFNAHPRSLELGTAVPYSDTHQFGWKAIPARPHDVLEFESFEILVEMVGEYVDAPLRGELM